MKVIGIIPAKAHSERVPGKNFRMFAGVSLFQWSVFYAEAEKVMPVISTDNEAVIDICQCSELACVREVVDESNMVNCIEQVLRVYDCDYFAVLQPTSPMRRAGLLRQMIRQCHEQQVPSIYTAEKVKIIGHIGGEFQMATRDQDPSTRFLYHFDGNILVVNTEWFRRHRRLFDNASAWVVEGVPYSLQIDTEDDFIVMEELKERF